MSKPNGRVPSNTLVIGSADDYQLVGATYKNPITVDKETWLRCLARKATQGMVEERMISVADRGRTVEIRNETRSELFIDLGPALEAAT